MANLDDVPNQESLQGESLLDDEFIDTDHPAKIFPKNIKYNRKCIITSFVASLTTLVFIFLVFWTFLPLIDRYFPIVTLPIKKVGTTATMKKENGTTFIYKQDIKENGFKVLILSDPHLSMLSSRTRWSLHAIVGHISREKPDLIIIAGDIVLGIFTNHKFVELCKLLEKFEVPFAFVLGNHDSQIPYVVGREDIIRICSSFTHSAIHVNEIDNKRYGNYAVHISDNEKIIRSFIFLDSGGKITKEEEKEFKIKGGYSFITANQIKFYKNSLYKGVNSTLIVHIPPEEFETAYKEGNVIRGERRETVSSSKYNSGMFKAVLESNSTDSIYVGHDHLNDFVSIYKGIRFVYIQNSGLPLDPPKRRWKLKNPDMLSGCTVMNIKYDGSFEDKSYFNSDFPEYFKGLGSHWFFWI